MINSAVRTPPSGAGVAAVTLDVDDTLVDHTASARAALYAVGGHEGTWELWQRITDEHAARVIRGELPYVTMHTLRTKAYFAELGDYVDDAQAEWIDSERKRALARLLRLFDDTLDCLEWLHASGLRVAAVTNASGQHQRAKLADLGIGGYFDAVVVAGEVGCAKPDPVIFHTACRGLGVAPDVTVHVGDRLRCDALGARDAGMHGVWLARGGQREAAPADVPVLGSLVELPEHLSCELELAPARAGGQVAAAGAPPVR